MDREIKEIKNYYDLITTELFKNTNTKLDFFDGFILEIAFNILLDGNEFFTINQIAEVLTNENINNDLLNRIENSLDKLCDTRIKINNINGYLLPCTIIRMEYKGKQFNLYKSKPEDSPYLEWLITKKGLKIKGIFHKEYQKCEIEKKDLEKALERLWDKLEELDELMEGE